MKKLIAKKCLYKTATIILVFILAFSAIPISFAASVNDIAPLLMKLESAYNQKDVARIADCFAYDMSYAYNAMAKLTGIDSNIFLSLLPFANSIISLYAEQNASNWPTCKLTPISYEGTDISGVLSYQVFLSYDNGKTEDFTSMLNVEKSGSDWKISLLQSSESIMFGSINSTMDENITVYDDITPEDLEKKIERYIVAKGDTTSWYQFVNTDGKTVFSGHFQAVGVDNGGYISVMNNGKWGLINHAGIIMLGYQYDRMYSCGNGYWKVQKGSKYGLINLKNGVGIDCIYDDMGIPNEGFVPVKKNQFWGLIDLQGNIAVDFMYMDAGQKVIHNLWNVTINKAQGVLDTKGNSVIKLTPDFKIRDIFENGFIVEGYGSTATMYNSKGKVVMVQDWNANWHPFTVKPITDDISFVRIYNKDELFMSDMDVIMDPEGNIILDLQKIVASKFEGITQCEVFPELCFGEWMGISLESLKAPFYSPEYWFNFINLDGEFLYKEPIPGNIKEATISPKCDIYVTPGIGSPKNILNLNNDTIYSVEGLFSSIIGDNYVVIHDKYIIDVANSKMYDIYGSLIYSSEDEKFERGFAASVTDGIYYGVLTSNGLLSRGMEYISVDHNDRSVYLQYGTEKEVVKIGSSNLCYKREGYINVPVSTTFFSSEEGHSMEGTVLERFKKREVVASDTILQDEEILLYQGPGINYAVIASFSIGTDFDVISDDGTMAYVIIGDKNGFIESRFINGSPEDGTNVTSK